MFYSAGERSAAWDAGGPYRASLAAFCSELQSSRVSLFVRSPAGRSSSGSVEDTGAGVGGAGGAASSPGRHGLGSTAAALPDGEDKWFPSPAASSPLHLAQFRFVGKLMGVAMRNKDYLNLSLARVVWTVLSGGVVTVADLARIDPATIAALYRYRCGDVVEEELAARALSFTTRPLGGGRTVELVPGGARRAVTMDNVREYGDLAIAWHLRQFAPQLDALRAGLASVVPVGLAVLFTSRELEEMVCGAATVDLRLLREVTVYERGYSASHPVVLRFWQTLEGMTEDERARFLVFVYGKPRLPLRAEEFRHRPTVSRMVPPAGVDVNLALPKVEACFFKLKLPPYTSAAVMRERLLFAMHNSPGIEEP